MDPPGLMPTRVVPRGALSFSQTFVSTRGVVWLYQRS